MPTFDSLWNAKPDHLDTKAFLSSHSIPSQDTISQMFYIIMYRNDTRGERRVYVGRTKDIARREGDHRRALERVFEDEEKEKLLVQHYQLARQTLRDGGKWRLIPLTFIRKNTDERRGVTLWAEQMLIAFFESYNNALTSQSDNDCQHLPQANSVTSWSRPFAKQLVDLTNTVKGTDEYATFRWTASGRERIMGCNWSSPMLEGHYNYTLWTRTAIIGGDGKPYMYQFRGPTRTVFDLGEDAPSYTMVLMPHSHSELQPKGFSLFVRKDMASGLKPGMKVHIMVEITADKNKRHPTPYWPAPEIGPVDVYADAARMATSGSLAHLRGVRDIP